jgi:hypothetical protein
MATPTGFAPKTFAPQHNFIRKIVNAVIRALPRIVELHFGLVSATISPGGAGFNKVVVFIDGAGANPGAAVSGKGGTAISVRARYMSYYSPTVGDPVVLLKVGTNSRIASQYVCLGKLA